MLKIIENECSRRFYIGVTLRKLKFAITILLLMTSVSSFSAENVREYSVFIPASLRYGAIKASEQKSLVEEVIKYTQKELNLNVKVELKGSPDEASYRQSWEEIFNEFKAGKEGVAIFASPLGYIEAEEQKVTMIPYLSVKVEGKNTATYCIYVNKESGIKNISQLKGKKINAINNMYGSILVLKKILEKNGIKEELNKFFSGGVYYQNDGAAIYALLNDKIDCFFSDDVSTKFAMRTIDDTNNLIPLTCSIPYTRTGFFGSKAKDTELMNKLINTIQNIDKNPGLHKFSSLMKGFGASFVKVNANDYNSWKQLYKEGKKKGWLKEVDNWEKKFLLWREEAIKAGRIKK